MVKKIAVILGILAMLALGAGMSWGYTVSKWPVPGISNMAFQPGGACLPGGGDCGTTLRGPVAPACDCPLLPGIIHAGLSVVPTVVGAAMTPLFTGGMPAFNGCCDVELGEPAYVTAAVPCTAVNRYVPPCGY